MSQPISAPTVPSTSTPAPAAATPAAKTATPVVQEPPLKLLVTSTPHVFSSDTVARIMWEVNAALLPALLVAWYVFGARALAVTAFSILGALVGEVVVQKFFLGKPASPCDGSAIVAGLLLAFCVPAALPLWIAFLGGLMAIVFGKQVFGGLGQNVFNPAHIGRAILLASWPVYMTTWVKPCTATGMCGALPDGVTMATPLGFMKEASRNPELAQKIKTAGISALDYMFQTLHLGWNDLLVGTMPGCIGETAKIALIIGGLYLFLRGHIPWTTPTAMMATVFVGSMLATGDPRLALFHLLAGGLIVGALFMATDMVTSPMTRTGQLIFGFGCGLITLIIRFKGGYPEGVCYSILIMNAFVPLIDKFTVPRRFGEIVATPAEV
ncbi:MAG TPA: RnfABCDGE type electron transport complex subunit D, partial [Candidatus Ozemobacteraceae bacterium]|nr:RnfABCDGE type electron transport complex subunit D [Candidatus Ozemobacteraceae bacterium]